MNWGASEAEWNWAKRLAKVDLLPVVSSPHAEISPKSKMKGMGKTPSLYNSQRQVAGFTGWTAWEANVKNIEAWMEEPDYGICIQTRLIRALDVDVADRKLSGKIAARFLELLGLDHLPTRWRADSGNQLLAFKLPGDWSKRSLVVKEWQEDGRTKRWIVEFLADGQQFIAIGTHPKGERYQWNEGELPAKFPEIDAKEFEPA